MKMLSRCFHCVDVFYYNCQLMLLMYNVTTEREFNGIAVKFVNEMSNLDRM